MVLDNNNLYPCLAINEYTYGNTNIDLGSSINSATNSANNTPCTILNTLSDTDLSNYTSSDDVISDSNDTDNIDITQSVNNLTTVKSLECINDISITDSMKCFIQSNDSIGDNFDYNFDDNFGDNFDDNFGNNFTSSNPAAILGNEDLVESWSNDQSLDDHMDLFKH